MTVGCEKGLKLVDGVRAATYLAANSTAARQSIEQNVLYDMVHRTFSPLEHVICQSVDRSSNESGTELWRLIFAEYNPIGDTLSNMLDDLHDMACKDFHGEWKNYWKKIADYRSALNSQGTPKPDRLTRHLIVTALKASPDKQWSGWGDNIARSKIPMTLVEINNEGNEEHVRKWGMSDPPPRPESKKPFRESAAVAGEGCRYDQCNSSHPKNECPSRQRSRPKTRTRGQKHSEKQKQEWKWEWKHWREGKEQEKEDLPQLQEGKRPPQARRVLVACQERRQDASALQEGGSRSRHLGRRRSRKLYGDRRVRHRG